MSLQDQKSFIASIPPFDRLTAPELARAADTLDVAYFPTGAVIGGADSTPEFVFIVIKGRVNERRDDEIIRIFSTGELFGAIGILRGHYRSRFEVTEELLAYQLPADAFQSLCRANPAFQSYFHDDLATKVQGLLDSERSRELASFMMARIDEAYLHPPLYLDADTSLHRAGLAMAEQKTTTALVRGAQGIGLVSLSSLYRAAVLKRLPLDSPVAAIARYELITLPRNDSLFNAMLTMTRHGISRVVVTETGSEAICGILEQSSLMSYYANHSHLVATEIRRAKSVENLARAARRLISMVQSLHAKGVKIRHIQRLVGTFNRQIYAKLFELIAPPELLENSCLILMGSEGREEQILKTDQDNALILREGFEHAHLQAFADDFSAALARLGYPPCPGGYMVSNPQWRQSRAALRDRFFNIMHAPDAQGLLDFAVLMDANPVAGDPALLEGLRGDLFGMLTDNPAFLTNFARNILAFETPLGLFAHFITEKDEHRNELDLKKGGIFPIVHGARSLALHKHIRATNTLERLRELARARILEEKFAEDLGEALDFMSGLRLSAMLDDLQHERPTDNYIRPQQLSRMEQDLLKDSLRLVDKFKKLVGHHFHLHLVT